MAMNDPHVERLQYRLMTDQNYSYGNPKPVSQDFKPYRLTLDKGVLTVELHDHHPTIGSAMSAVKGHLRAWELQTAIQFGPGRLKFEFLDANVIDRNPPPPGTPVVYEASASVNLSITGHIEAHVTLNSYPDLPAAFAPTPLVEALWYRYNQYRVGKEPLAGMGFFCLSAVQDHIGGKKGAQTSAFSTRSTKTCWTTSAPSRPTSGTRRPPASWKPPARNERTPGKRSRGWRRPRRS